MYGYTQSHSVIDDKIVHITVLIRNLFTDKRRPNTIVLRDTRIMFIRPSSVLSLCLRDIGSYTLRTDVLYVNNVII